MSRSNVLSLLPQLVFPETGLGGVSPEGETPVGVSGVLLRGRRHLWRERHLESLNKHISFVTTIDI
jgi:hypothetical protein